jgi:hypothetical protein
MLRRRMRLLLLQMLCGMLRQRARETQEDGFQLGAAAFTWGIPASVPLDTREFAISVPCNSCPYPLPRETTIRDLRESEQAS